MRGWIATRRVRAAAPAVGAALVLGLLIGVAVGVALATIRGGTTDVDW